MKNIWFLWVEPESKNDKRKKKKNNEAKSIFEKNEESKNEKIQEFKKSKIAMEIEEAFPDAKLVDLKEE